MATASQLRNLCILAAEHLRGVPLSGQSPAVMAHLWQDVGTIDQEAQALMAEEAKVASVESVAAKS